MTIKVGARLPDGKLSESIEFDAACPMPPKDVAVAEALKGKKVVLFALPGAFTPTCSAKHLPGFVQQADAFRAKGVDTIACMSVNDAFVMDAWGRDQQVGDKVKLLADGNATFAKALGLELDATGVGLGIRSQRFAMVVQDGVVKGLHVEQPGAFEVSSAEAVLKTL